MQPPLDRLRERLDADVSILLISDRDESEVAARARALGASSHRSGLNSREKLEILEVARSQGHRPCLVGDVGGLAGVASAAFVTVLARRRARVGP